MNHPKQSPQFLYFPFLFLCILFMFFHTASRSENTQTTPVPSLQGSYIDPHVHLNGVIEPDRSATMGQGLGPNQGKKGTGPQGRIIQKDYAGAADSLIQLMDQFGVSKVLIMSPPQIAEQRGRNISGAADLTRAVQKYPKRLFLAAGGDDLNPMIHETPSTAVTEIIKNNFRKEAESLANLGIKAFGEMAALHISMNPNHPFEQAPPDHPLFLLLSDIAAENNIPIDLHMEAVPQTMTTPENLRRISPLNPATLSENITGLERLLDHNTKTEIVWQHMGWDNVGFMSIELMSRLLDAHPNLYLGFKITMDRLQGGTNTPRVNRMVDDNFKIKPEWLEFIKKYPDRILAASDGKCGFSTGRQGDQKSLELTWILVNQLPPDVAQKVGRDNAIRIYGL